MKKYVRNRQLTVSADGVSNQTPFLTCKKGGMVTLEGTFVATVTPQRRGVDGNIVDVTDSGGAVTTFTLPGTYPLNPEWVAGDYRLNIKSGAFTSGSIIMLLEGR